MRKGNNPGARVLMYVLPTELRAEPSDSHVRITHNNNTTRSLYPVWAGEGFPSDVRQAIAELNHPEKTTPVITARRLTQGAQELLNQARISWADAAGYANITDESGLYVARLRPKPLPRSATNAISWSPTTRTVAEFVLSRIVQNKEFARVDALGIDRTAYIAESTGISHGQVGKVLAAFDDEGYTAKFGPERGPTSIRRPRDPRRLLSEWAGNYRTATHTKLRAELHVPSRDPSHWNNIVTCQLEGMTWAHSGWTAADIMAPYTSHVPDMIVYVNETDFDAALAQLVAHPEVTQVDRGGRIHLREAEPHVFQFTHTNQHRMTSPVRVYADLLRIGNRGAEAAEHLREVAIEF